MTVPAVSPPRPAGRGDRMTGAFPRARVAAARELAASGAAELPGGRRWRHEQREWITPDGAPDDGASTLAGAVALIGELPADAALCGRVAGYAVMAEGLAGHHRAAPDDYVDDAAVRALGLGGGGGAWRPACSRVRCRAASC